MPNNVVKSAAKKSHVSVNKAEDYWATAKNNCDSEDYKCINGTFQKIMKNVKNKKEAVLKEAILGPQALKGKQEMARSLVMTMTREKTISKYKPIFKEAENADPKGRLKDLTKLKTTLEKLQKDNPYIFNELGRAISRVTAKIDEITAMKREAK